MSSIQLHCIKHDKKVEYICEKQSCENRQLCTECLKDPHFKEHKYMIVNVREFLYDQNKSRTELILILEKKLLNIKTGIEKYEEFVMEKNQEIDQDFEYLIKSFNSILDSIKKYLKEGICKELRDISKSYELQKTNFRKLKEMIELSSNQGDFLVNYEKQPVLECIEKLVVKNKEINEDHQNIRYLEKNLSQSYDNRVFYKINNNNMLIQEDLFKIFNSYFLKFCRKFRLMLVRPSLEEDLNKKTQIIREKLYQELIPENFQNQSILLSTNMSQMNQTTNNSIFYNMKTDKEIIKAQTLKLPEHVIILSQNFGDFNSPKKISHVKFVELEKKQALLLEDGSIYEGEWDKFGSRTGQGKCLFNDGTFYDGFWVDGSPHILGRYIKSNGDLLEGLIKRGKMEGKAVQVDLKGYKYVGYWKDNMKHGQGTENFPNGVIYKGEFMFDKHHGKGELILPNNSKYKGEFFDGKFNGTGEFVWANGERYDGEWAEDLKHGLGRYVYEDGKIYEGDFCEDLPHGFGKLIQKDGNIVEGFWDLGKPIGMAIKQLGNDKEAKSFFFDEINELEKNADLSLFE